MALDGGEGQGEGGEGDSVLDLTAQSKNESGQTTVRQKSSLTPFFFSTTSSASGRSRCRRFHRAVPRVCKSDGRGLRIVPYCVSWCAIFAIASIMLLRKNGPKIDGQDIKQLCERFSITLPNDYSDWLLVQNGGIPEHSLFIKGQTTKVIRFFSLFPNNENDGLDCFAAAFEEDFGKLEFFPFAMNNEFWQLFIDLRQRTFGSILELKNYPLDYGADRPTWVEVDISFHEFVKNLNEVPEPGDCVVEFAKSSDSMLDQWVASGNDILKKSRHGHSLAEEAAKNGNLKLLREWTKMELPLGVCLHLAALNENVEILKYLLSIGADVEVRDEFGRLPHEVSTKAYINDLFHV